VVEYIARRLLLTIPTLLGVSIILFVLVRVLPGDAALVKAGEALTGATDEATLNAMRQQMGLDKPIEVQYGLWLGKLLRGDLGVSLRSGERTLGELINRLPVTLELAIGSSLVSVIVGLLLGVIAAVYQDRPLDYFARLFGVLGLSVPSFWLGTLLIIVPAVTIGYMPPLSYVSPFQDLATNVRQFLAPCLALGWALSASVMRMTRSQMLEVLRDDYIRTARAKGLRGTQVLFRHALKNALIPVITITGVQVGFLLGGTVVVEQVYGLPGVGMGTLDAVMLRDYPIIQTNVLFLTVAFVFINLVVDLAYGWLDPRVRYA